MSTDERDDLIGTAYEQLDGALAPPLDGADRVARRVAVRRRNRRVLRTGIATIAVVGIVGGVALARSGDSPEGTVAVDQPSEPTSTLVLTRPDGTTYAFPDVTVSCDPPVANGDDVVMDDIPGHIWAYSPIEFEGTIDGEEEDFTLTRPFLMVEGILSELQEERAFDFPIEGPRGASPEPVNVFIADTAGASDGNELSSSVGDVGTVRVLEASCDPVPVLRLEVDGTLGSEENKQSVDITGELR